MPEHHVNELPFRGSQHREAAVATLDDDTDIDDVVRALRDAGIPADRLYFIEGERGALLVEETGNFISRLFTAELRDRPPAALREGKTLLLVAGVRDDDADTVRTTLGGAGLVNVHYFGRWTYS